jgi:hypothetical protein
MPDAVARSARRTAWLAWAAVLASLIVLALFGFQGVLGTVKANQRGAEAYAGLCALKADYERRLVETEKFIKRNPNGLPQLGFTRAELDRSRDALQTLTAGLDAELKSC